VSASTVPQEDTVLKLTVVEMVTSALRDTTVRIGLRTLSNTLVLLGRTATFGVHTVWKTVLHAWQAHTALRVQQGRSLAPLELTAPFLAWGKSPVALSVQPGTTAQTTD